MSGFTNVPRFRPPHLVALGLLVALALISFAPLSTSRMHIWPWKGLALVLWITPILWLGVRTSSRRPFVWPPTLLFAGLVLLSFAAVASGILSPHRPLSLPHVWPTLGGVAAVLLLHDTLARDARAFAWTALVLAAAGGLLALVSLLQWSWTAGTTEWSDRNAYPFGHSTYTAGALVWGLPWLFWATVQAGQRGRLLAGLGLVLAVIALISTKSRAGVLGAGTSAGVAGVLFVLQAQWSRGRKALVALIGLCAGVALILSNERLRHLVFTGEWSATAQESNEQRSAMLEAGSLIGQERPFLGWGPGTVPVRYPTVRGELASGVDNVLQLHNTPLQVWATVGATGVLAMVLLLAGVTQAAWGALTRRRAPAERPAPGNIGSPGTVSDVAGGSAQSSFTPLGHHGPLFAAVSAVAGYTVFALTDHQLDVPFMNAMAATHVAMLAAASHKKCLWGSVQAAASPADVRRETAKPSPLQRTIGLIPLLLVAALLWPTTRDLLARRAYAHDDFEQAIEWMPSDAYYHHQLASQQLKRRFAAADASERQRWTQAAVETLEGSLLTGVHEEYAHFNLGWLTLDLGQPQRAAEHFVEAAQRAPTRGGVYFGLGLALLQQERAADAVRAFALEALSETTSLRAPVWETPALASLLPAIRRELETLPEKAPAAWQERVSQRVAWIQWWSEDDPDVPPPPGFSEHAMRFGETFVLMGQGAALLNVVHPWERLYEAWRKQEWPAFHPDGEFTAALQRRAQRHTTFSGFLKAGTEGEPALLHSVYRVRPGAGLHAFHPDGPPLMDAFVVQTNRVLSYAAALFPPRHAMPAPVLLELMPRNGTSNK